MSRSRAERGGDGRDEHQRHGAHQKGRAAAPEAGGQRQPRDQLQPGQKEREQVQQGSRQDAVIVGGLRGTGSGCAILSSEA